VSRLHVLARRPKRTLAALSTALVAVGVTVASGADFTAASANPSNVFSAGSLTINNSKEGSAILSASNMRPGDPATTGTVDIENAGSLSGAFSLSRQSPADSDSAHPLSSKLNLVVVDCGAFAGSTIPTCGDGDDVTKYSGTVAAMSGSTALGTYAAAEKHRYKFSVALDSSAGNVFQGGSSTVEFDWAAA
jgi:spore coat-associated protein N